METNSVRGAEKVRGSWKGAKGQGDSSFVSEGNDQEERISGDAEEGVID